jgi:formate dehydrogenase major subunit
MVNINIDGNKIEVPEGTTVLQAARLAGVTIPTLCDHPELTPYGGCRLCLVEVEGARTLQPSCTLPVSNNMVVRTDTERTKEARKFVLTMIFSERNHFCMFCQVSGGDCELQNSAYREGMTHWPLSPNYQAFSVDASNPYFVLDQNRCILCRRCVRACNELVGNFTLGFEERGAKSLLVADFGVPLGQSSCVSCGTCVQVCPTGALIDRESAYKGRETQVERVHTTCIECSVGCGLDVLTRDNQVVRIEGDWETPVSRGLICKKGRFIPVNEERERVLTPLVRKNGNQKAATWDEALETVASHLKPLAGEKTGGIAAIASTRLPVEALSLYRQLFAGKAQSALVTSTEEGAYTTAAHAIAKEITKPFEGKLDKIKKADCVVAVGVDLVNDHEVVGFFLKRSLPNGTRLVLVDSRANPLENLAKVALHIARDTESDVLLGIAAAVVQLGLAKNQPDVNLSKYTPEYVNQKADVSPEVLHEAAILIGSSKLPAFVFGSEITSQKDPSSIKALLELAHVVGALNQDDSSVLGVKGQANSLAASMLDLEKPFEMDGEQAIFLALGDDTPSQKLLKSIGEAPFLAVQASYVSAATTKADVVLPVEIWCEQEGHFINLEGRIQATARAIKPADGIHSNVEVISDLAARLGISLDTDWKSQLAQASSPVAIEEQ